VEAYRRFPRASEGLGTRLDGGRGLVWRLDTSMSGAAPASGINFKAERAVCLRQLVSSNAAH
jgi:hypothetical protein